MNPQVRDAIRADALLDARAANAQDDQAQRAEHELIAFADVANSEAWRHVRDEINKMQAQAFTHCAIAEGVEVLRWQGEIRALEVLREKYDKAKDQLEASRKEAG
jgi:hypothetical protein